MIYTQKIQKAIKFAAKTHNHYQQQTRKGKVSLIYPTWWSRSVKVTTSDTLEFCGIKTQSVLFGDCRTLDAKKKTQIHEKVTAEMEKFLSV